MTGWHVLVPFKLGQGGKSRLAPLLSPSDRAAMALHMARHVLDELSGLPGLASLSLLTAERPGWWQGGWVRDEGRGLNCELEHWRAGLAEAPALVIHADLPLLQAAEVCELLEAARRSGAALATDRAGTGSNALALADGRPFAYRFGPDSRALHAAQAPAMPVLSLPGLMADLDTPEDLALLRAGGFPF